MKNYINVLPCAFSDWNVYWITVVYGVNHNDCILRFTMRDKLPTAIVIN